MAIGRISGPMLRANLERQGVDLSIETDLLYVDVNNNRIGINQAVPTKSLQVDNVTIENNQIRSVSGDLDLGAIADITITGGSNGYYLKTDGSGNLSFAEVVTNFTISDGSVTDTFNTGETLTFSGTAPITTSVSNNQITFAANNATTSTVGVASFDSNDFSVTSGAVSIKTSGVSNTQLAGSISNDKLVNSSLTIGSDSISLGSTQTDLNGITSLDVDNITVDGNTISSTDTNGNITIDPDGTGQLVIVGNNAVTIPTGTTAQRPTGSTGDIRINTTTGNFEYYDGSSWQVIAPSTGILSIDTFNGDDSTVAFTLSASTTSGATIITLNGVVQSPGNAYNISGTTLTFTEAPKTGDAIEVRYISTAYTPGSQISDLDTSVTVDDSSANIVSKINNSNVIVTTASSTTITNDLVVEGAIKSDTFYFVKRSTNTSITYPGSYGAVTIDYEDAGDDYGSTDAMWDSSTDRFTPTVAGLWYIRASIDAYPGATSEAGIYIEKNGSVVAQNSTIGFIRGQVTTHLYMNGSTDYVQFKAYTQGSTTRSQQAENSFFEALLVKQAE
jgi:hypothetical protein